MVWGACSGGSACVGINTTWATIYFFGSFFSMFLILFIIFLFWKTPAMEFLLSWITGRSVVLVANRSNQGRFRLGKTNAEGMLDVSRSGPVVITENSYIIEQISGRPMYIVFGEFAATLPLWWIGIVNKLKKLARLKGKDLNNSSDLGEVMGRVYNESSGKWEKTTIGDEENKNIEVEPWITLKLSDLANMFPWNITPALIYSKIEYSLARQMKFWKTDTGRLVTYVTVFIMLIVGAYLAYKFFGGGAPKVSIVVDQAGKILSTQSENGLQAMSG